MTSKTLPRSIFRGPVRLGGVTLDGHVLDTGQRVFSLRDLGGALSDGSGAKDAHFERRAAAILGDSAVVELGPRIEFVAQGGVHHGYPVEVLAKVCAAYVSRFMAGDLHPKQEAVARRAWELQQAWATIGLVALFDEGTGYQEHRKKTALQDQLALLLRENAGPYAQLFSERFFVELARLHRVPVGPHGQRPRSFGKFLAKYFYRWLSPEAYAVLAERVPANESGRRPAKLHPHLTDGARQLFERHQDVVIALMMNSASLRDFDRRFGVAFRGHALQLPLTG